MRIAVVSDIHYPKRLFAFPDKLGDLSKYDLVVGLGDYISQDVIDFIRSVSKKAFFVAGNADNVFIKGYYPSKLILSAEGLSIGISHGYGHPNNLARRLLNEFTDIDILLYGHTHVQDDRVIGKTRVLNPGAYLENQSIGILTLDNKKIISWEVKCLI